MSDPRTPQRTDSPRRGREQRRAAAVVAQYLNKLSGRHAGQRRPTQAQSRA